MDDLQELLGSDRFKRLFLILVAGLLVIAALQWLLGGKKGRAVLLMGASGSGKTTLFHQLRDGGVHQGTVPSMRPNEDKVVLKLDKAGSKVQRSLEMVDIPGHPKVRGEAARFYGRTKAILFLVDAVDFMAQKTAVAEQLYEVISDPILQRRGVPLLLVCNKTDEGVKAHTTDFVRKRLEKELEALRGTRATLGEGAPQGARIAKEGEAFSFAGLRSPKVKVVGGSALTGDLQEVLDFLR